MEIYMIQTKSKKVFFLSKRWRQNKQKNFLVNETTRRKKLILFIVQCSH